MQHLTHADGRAHYALIFIHFVQRTHKRYDIHYAKQR